jgi:hypothetical protein
MHTHDTPLSPPSTQGAQMCAKNLKNQPQEDGIYNVRQLLLVLNSLLKKEKILAKSNCEIILFFPFPNER